MINIKIPDYKLFYYELEYLKREILGLGGQIRGEIRRGNTVQVDGISRKDALNLTYAEGIIAEDSIIPTLQYRRESCNGIKKGQSTRYGPHCLHEYKGRFNPHHPRSIILREFEEVKSVILDPFMGSGTTLVESRGLGHKAVGIELNIFAWLIASAKKYYEEIDAIPQVVVKSRRQDFLEPIARDYLAKWFPTEQLADLENILYSISSFSLKERTILQIILSDLLREHSLQDPDDLRIRRRKEVPNNISLLNSFYESMEKHRDRHKKWICEFGKKRVRTLPIHGDSTRLSKIVKPSIDGTVTSPPYASALPYVDTYRLSMVALGLIKSNEILKSEKALIGSRDISKDDKEMYKLKLNQLPSTVSKTIKYIKNEIDSDGSSGFRKRAVPYSLTNYSTLMLSVFKELYKVEKEGAKNFWVVGPNKVKLGLEWYTINTPILLGALAETAGFKKIGIKTVQSYSRYNLHSKNSIGSEFVLEFIKHDR